MTTEIGRRLASVRSKETQLGFAKRLGVHKNTLIRYEKGERLPDAEFLAKLAATCGVNIHWLITGEGPERIGEPVQAVAGEPLDRDLLREIIEGVEEGLRQAGRTMTPEKKAQLILALYDLYSKEHIKPNKDNVIQFVKAA